MGTSHIFYLYDDALGPARDDPAARDRLALDLGRAIIDLVTRPDFIEPEGGEAPHRVTWSRVGEHGNALHWCDEVHSSEVRLYVWAGNCLRELGDIEKCNNRDARKAIERWLGQREGLR